MVGLEFGAVGGSQFCKNGSVWVDNEVGRMVGPEGAGEVLGAEELEMVVNRSLDSA